MDSKSVFGKLQEFKTNHFGHISRPQLWIGIVFSSLFINVLALVFPLALLQMYDRVIPNQSLDTLAALVLIIAVAMVFELILRIGRAVLTAWCNARLEYDLTTHAYEKLLKTSLHTFEKEGSGAHLEKISSLNSLKDFFGGQAITSILDFPFVLVYLGLIAFIGGWLVLAPIFVLSLFCVIAYLLGKSMRETLSARRTADDRRLNFIIESLLGIHTIKSMAMEPLILRRYERLQKSTGHSDHDLSFKSTLTTSSTSLLSHINMLFIVSFGSVMAINGSLTIGGLAACTLLANRTLNPLSKAMNTWKRFQSISLAQKRLESISDLEDEYADDAYNLKNIQGKVELRNISFEVDNQEDKILNNISLSVNPGEVISISGKGQSGKTTLLWLLMGVLKASSGSVLIDGKNINTLAQRDLRHSIGYLPQHGILFEGTIIENITMFRGHEYLQKGLDAAHLLDLDKDIYKLPKGFDTHIGNRSIDFLPNGLRQRICIARALVNEPRIVLFDEANCAVDQQADAKLIDVLKHLRGKCTLIIVSHRPSVLKLADRKFQLLDGELKEQDGGNGERTITSRYGNT